MMSHFLTALCILGGCVLLAVILFNEWQQRRAGLRTLKGEKPPAAARLDNHAHEPAAMAHEAQNTLAAKSTDNAQEAPFLFPPAPSHTPRLDPLIDTIVAIEFAQPQYGEVLSPAIPTSQRIGSKPFFVEGLSAESGYWEYLHSGKQYSQLQAGMQLVNRMGAINEIEFSDFARVVQNTADAVGGEIQLPTMSEELARARELDEFASRSDAQIDLRIRSRSAAWSAGYIDSHAQRLGFVAGMRAGRKVYPATHAMPNTVAQPLITLTFDAHAALAEDLSESAVYEIALVLNAPQVPRESQAYPLLCQIAQELSKNMDGTITNAQGAIISEAIMQTTGQQLEALYDQLEARDLHAGSALAQRLFS